MRNMRILALAALIVLAVLSAGCMKGTWVYDFTAQSADLDDWYYSYGDYDLSSEGLSMYHGILTTPVWFSGDMTISIEFMLDVDDFNHARIDFWLSDDILWDYNVGVYSELFCLGNTESEGWYFSEWDENNSSSRSYYAPIPSLVHEGINKLILTKAGNSYRITVNGTYIISERALYFNNEQNFFSIFTGGPVGNLTIRKIEISYSGDISDPWPI